MTEREDLMEQMPGLWCDDITFCPNKCELTECPRNEQNIRDRAIPHSYFVWTPPDCPKQGSEVEQE